jgi:hypothetical protein
MKERPYGIICYWKYEPDEKSRKLWVLAESYPIDMDGYALGPTSTGGGRNEWDKWMCKYDEDEPEQIKGRAVTCWSFSGVSLMRFHPPEWCPWLSGRAYEELCKMENWYSLLERGYDLYLGTIEAAKKIMFGE